ncbi:MAG: hypothetical protein ACOCRX_04930 [Candidatus Woesearchaeota archaeon]
MIFKDEENIKGHLKIYGKHKSGLIKEIHSDFNVILDSHRGSLPNITALDPDNDEDIITAVKSIIPKYIHLDNSGVYLNGDGDEVIKSPVLTDRIDTEEENYYMQEITNRSLGEEYNTAIFTSVVDTDSANGRKFSRAMLSAEDETPLALKCFGEIPKKRDWELIFEWHIYY